MSINLLKDKEKWLDKIDAIKQMIQKEIKGRIPKECNLWLMHINY